MPMRPEATAGLDAFCTEVLAAHACPSVSVAVAEDGAVVHTGAYGTADAARELPATPGTAYGLASVTKPVTATAVCLAADEGLLDLDAPLPYGYAGSGGHPRPSRWPAPTARQLLGHRGGLGAHYDLHYGDGPRQIDPDPYTELHRAPGSAFEYANLGYRLLGRALEAAAGQPFEEFVRERVFEPLGLGGCHMGPAYPGPAPSAVRYTVDGRPYPRCDCSHPGATLGWAPAPELALFGQRYDRLLRPETAARMREALPVNAGLGYGLGWCVSLGDGPLVLSHGGGMGGVAAMLAVVPALRLSVAVLTNSTGKAARDAIVARLLRSLMPGWRPGHIDPAPDDPARPVTLPESTWAGGIRTPEGDVPVSLRLGAGSRAELRLDGRGATAAAHASAALDLRAAFPLQLPTADARINSPELGLELRLDGGRLSGVARAFRSGDAEGLLGSLLSHPCALERLGDDRISGRRNGR